MKFLIDRWAIFDNLNEIVYISNINTNEICYINKRTMEVFNIDSLESVLGKKCYNVFRGQQTPCEFCNNKILKKNEFCEWQNFNSHIGKLLSLKNTLIEENGEKYRLEFAFDMSVQEDQKRIIDAYANNESVLNRGLKLALSEDDPDNSIKIMVNYLGEQMKSDRAYIFEKTEANTWNNTYEWCREGINPEKDNLQNLPYDSATIWLQTFNGGKNILISDLEKTKLDDPVMYEILKPQGIKALVVSPIYNKDEIIGFFGVDNPPKSVLKNISTLFSITGHFMSFLLKRRDMFNNLELLGLHDQLTGLKNRHAMWEFVNNLSSFKNIGILFGDITGLKIINDTYGHNYGDELLITASKCLKDKFHTSEIFRIGGDEFVVICNDITEKDFFNRTSELRIMLKENKATMAIGDVWVPKIDKPFNQILNDADEKMYEEKKKYYEDKHLDRRGRKR